ncbi:MAG: prolyl oligopeptidase family serine peptidase [Actinomycetota bacterium]
MIPRPPDRSADATWKQRFRFPRLDGLQVARRNRDRALVLSDQTGVTQAYALDLRSGEMRQMTDAPSGSVLAMISPDGRFVFALEDVGGNEVGHWARRPIEGGPVLDLTPNMPAYSSWEIAASDDGDMVAIGVSDDDGTSVWICRPDAEHTDPTRLLTAPGLIRRMAFTSDGGSVVCQTSGPTGSNASALVAIDAATGAELATLWDGAPSSMGTPVASPVAGDRRVASTSNVSGRERPLLWDLATGERRDLDLDVEGDIDTLDWSDDGRHLLLGVSERATESLWRFDLESSIGDRIDVGGGSVLDGAAFGSGGIIVRRDRATEPTTVIEVGQHDERTIVRAPGAPGGHPLRSVSFPSSDGTSVQAWVVTPDGDGPYPTILHVHGGPESVTTERYWPAVSSWVDHGYAVASLNYRGSVTFGREYQQAIWGDLGHWEVEDLAATAAWLVGERIAAPRGIVLTGGSYGGYLTLLGLGRRPDLWAGGVAYVAVADWVRMYEESAGTLRAYEEQIFEGPPDAKPDVYRRASPITYVEQLDAPLLVFQGSNDTRCPPGQFQAYEAAARASGKSIEVEWFDAGHIGPDTEQLIAFQERSLAFTYAIFAGAPS